MRFRVVWVVVALAVLFRAPSTFAEQKSSSSRDAGPVRFRLIDGYRIVVACPVGTAGKMYNFLVDTGANPSVIDSKLSAELGLAGHNLGLALPNGTIEGRLVELPMLAIGPIRRLRLPVLVRDLTYLQHGIRVDGIVGMDVLTAMSFTIDYQHRKLLFGGEIPKDEDAVDFASGPPFITVLMDVNGGPMKVLVDTGTPGTLLFATRVRGRLKGTQFLGGATGTNMAGQFRVEQMLLENVRLGQISLRQYPATLLKDSPEWGQVFDGLIGPSGLNVKRITFDFEDGKVRWKY